MIFVQEQNNPKYPKILFAIFLFVFAKFLTPCIWQGRPTTTILSESSNSSKASETETTKYLLPLLDKISCLVLAINDTGTKGLSSLYLTTKAPVIIFFSKR